MEQPFEEEVVTEESVVVTKRGRKPKAETIVESEEQSELTALETKAEEHKYEVSATDLIATLYTYAPSPVKKGNFKQAGKCLLCGVSTAAAERKICWECINKHRDDLTVI